MQTHLFICIALIAAAAVASKSACAQPYPSRPVHIVVPFAQPWQSDQLRVIGFGTTRLPKYPDVPTLAESGLPGYEAGSWYGPAAPKGTPPDIIATLNAETRRIFADPAFRDTGLKPE